MKEDYDSIEQKSDTVLEWIKNTRWSAVIIAVFWLTGYFSGYYVGHFIHWLGQLF